MATGFAPPSAAQPQQLNIGGIVSAKSLSAVLAEETMAAQKRMAAEGLAKRQNNTVITSLASLVHKHWTLAKQAKQTVEQEMLSAVRSRKGEYDPDVLADIRSQGGSEIYMMIFATKARQLKALLTDILVGTGSDKPWTIQATPSPELPPGEVNQIMQAVYAETMQAEMMGMPMSVEDVRQRLSDARTAIEDRIMETARREAERAESYVEDSLSQGGYLDALDQFLDDLTTFKTAFINGPVVRKTNELSWQKGPDGIPRAVVTERYREFYERVDPFMMYPAPWSNGVHDAYLIHRHRLSRGEISALIGVDGYDEEAVRKVLDEHGTGGLREWLMIDTARATAEGREQDANVNSELIDALQYWGSVSGKMLREWGMSATEAPDEAKEYEVEVWVIGSYVIKALINPDPLKRRPYYTDGFSRIPGAFWHNSLFDVVRDCQDMCNGAARALSNNMGIASGPQVWMNVERLAQGETVTELFPWKITQMTSDPMGSTAPPMGFFQPTSNANELMTVYERFSIMADEYSGIPKYLAGMTGGEGGAGRTASGLAMMVGNASKQIKQVLASVDLNVISPMVERQYHQELMYHPEKRISGDVSTVARGALSLIAKEASQLRLNEFLAATGNPVDMQIVGLDGRAELLRHAVKRLDINSDKVVPSATAVKIRAAQQQMAMMAQQGAQGGAPQPGGRAPRPGGSGQQLMNGAPVTDNFSPAPKPAPAMA